MKIVHVCREFFAAERAIRQKVTGRQHFQGILQIPFIENGQKAAADAFRMPCLHEPIIASFGGRRATGWNMARGGGVGFGAPFR